jgi:hypothetical protein
VRRPAPWLGGHWGWPPSRRRNQSGGPVYGEVMRSRGRRVGPLLRRLATVPLLAAAYLLVSAGPASAHAIGGTQATNYQTRVHAVRPQTDGLTVRAIEAGARLELVNRGRQDVVVLGYSGEPYLRVGPRGVDENRRSPSLWTNRSIDGAPIPQEADAKAEPEWHHVSDEPRVAWHDHRTHWMSQEDPPAVRQAPGDVHVIYPEWTIRLRQGDRTILVTGDLRWVPGVSPAPWLVGAAVLALAVVVAGGTPWWAGLLSGGLALLAAVDLAHTGSTWVGTATPVAAKLYGSAISAAGWTVAALAVARLLRGRTESGLFYLLFSAALLAVIGGLGDLSSLSSSQLVGALPAPAIRAAVATKIGLGLGLVLAGLLRLRRTAALAAQQHPAAEEHSGDAAPGPAA